MKLRTKAELDAYRAILKEAAAHITSDWGEPLKDVECADEVVDSLPDLARQAARDIRTMARVAKVEE